MKKLPIKQVLHGLRLICLFLIFLMLVTSCQLPTKSLDTYISKEGAIDEALKIASSSRPEISGAQVTPSNIIARQMTLSEAVKMINKGNQVPTGYDTQMLVWFVTMDGLWLGEMPAPGITPIPELVPYHHFAIILDAKTGLEIEDSISP